MKQRKTNSHHIRLTEILEEWVEEKSRTYRSPSAFIMTLIRDAYEADQRQQPRKALKLVA